ncbi:MAG TPA: thymidylate kinase [Methanomassiliicoccales archaeon]
MRWIVIDGIDGSGKSTYAGLIAEYYQDRGERVIVHVHPSTGRLGRISRKALESNGKAMHIVATVFFVADVLRSLSLLKKEGKIYDTVIFVRYVLATAYLPDRLAPIGYEFISKLLPMPKRLMLIDIDPAIANERISRRAEKKEMFEDPANLIRAREKLRSLASKEWRIIDNSLPMDMGRESLYRILEDWDRTYD